MAVPLMAIDRRVAVPSKVAPISWFTQVKAEPLPLFCQFAVPVSQMLLLVPFQVAVALIPVCKLAGFV